jgi:cytochrome c peroxidase
MIRLKFGFLFLAFLFAVSSCKKEDPKNDTFKGFEVPQGFPQPTYAFQTNPVTKEGFELGKKLFYDGRLSRDGTVSCGTCHISFSAFTQHGHDVSHGIEDRLGIRNTPAVQNMAWMETFFWDGGVHNLDLLPINPIENPVEMDESVNNVIAKLKADPEYVKKFKAAFGTEEITGAKMMQAMSQFMCMLVSADSKYDQVLRGAASFTQEESDGKLIFEQKCSSCHSGILFTDQKFRNNGLLNYTDKGRYEITLNPADAYCFKVPSLRNLEYTAPYMHDGRFASLSEVIDHYRFGVNDSPTLDTLLKTNSTLGIAITNDEKTKLIAFLKALSDESFVKNPLFAEF